MIKKIVSLILVITMLLCSNVFALYIFRDVSDTHWAFWYIYNARKFNIINGYTDGYFRPENKVKTGEFVKMVTVALWPEYKYKTPENGEHWAMPYVKSLDKILLLKSEYDTARLEKIITRAEAARLLSLLYANKYGRDLLDDKEEYVNNFTDEALITNKVQRIAIDECVKFGLINGFEDGSFRPNDGLTRAQAAKILCLVVAKPEK